MRLSCKVRLENGSWLEGSCQLFIYSSQIIALKKTPQAGRKDKPIRMYANIFPLLSIICQCEVPAVFHDHIL